MLRFQSSQLGIWKSYNLGDNKPSDILWLALHRQGLVSWYGNATWTHEQVHNTRNTETPNGLAASATDPMVV